MTFPLGSANFLLLLCELWCWGRALLTNTTTTGSHWLEPAQALAVARQFIRWLLTQNTHRNRHADTHTHTAYLYLPHALLLSFFHSYTDKHKNSQIWQSQTTETQKKDRSWPKGVCLSALPHQFHQRYERPIRFSCQSGTLSVPKHRNGSFKDCSLMAPSFLCYSLH